MLTKVKNQESWNKLLRAVGEYDCYHTYEYHEITRKPSEESFLLKYESGSTLILVPFVKRRIVGTPYFDLTSVYGYAGPLMNTKTTESDIKLFQQLFKDFIQKEKVVSVFSRLHPFLSFQEPVLQGIGDVVPIGPVVNIDLTKALEDQRSAFSKTTKRYLNKLKRQFYVYLGKSETDIDDFVTLYESTMDRVDASESYYFSREYYSKFLRSTEFETDLIFAKTLDQHQVASAAIMIKTGNIVQYHLSGTHQEYLGSSPLRMLIDDTRTRATEQGYKYFNLGGGVGGREDSLLRFKSSFSKDYKAFKIWKYIADPKVYEELCREAGLDLSGDPESEANGFFPLYRMKDVKTGAY